LKYQLDLIQENYKDKDIAKLGKKLLEKLPVFFEDITIKSSLIHGDLWSGNWGADSEGNPVIFDPAAYFGHSEAELSIMNMFGGFSSSFWNEYYQHIPRTKGFENRHHLYQLYHYLNHMNLFGTGYKSSCWRLLNLLV